MRIISLIPGATEIVSALGLINSLVGVSHECDYPNEVIKLPKLTKSNVKDTNVSFKIHNDIKKKVIMEFSEEIEDEGDKICVKSNQTWKKIFKNKK